MARNELICAFRNNVYVMRDGNFLDIKEKLPNDILRHLDIFSDDRNNKVNVHYRVYMGQNRIADSMLILMDVHTIGLMDNSGGKDGFDAIIYLTFRSADEVESKVSVDLFYKSMDDAKRDLEIIKSLLGEEK